MKYGFTPGMGATCILPRKLGISLSEELLITSANYRGADLEKRGVPFPVLPRVEVLNHAVELAREIAEKPRYSLVLLKKSPSCSDTSGITFHYRTRSDHA